MREQEVRCPKTGSGEHQWIWDDEEEFCSMYCLECFADRDWTKDDYAAPKDGDE